MRQKHQNPAKWTKHEKGASFWSLCNFHFDKCSFHLSRECSDKHEPEEEEEVTATHTQRRVLRLNPSVISCEPWSCESCCKLSWKTVREKETQREEEREGIRRRKSALLGSSYWLKCSPTCLCPPSETTGCSMYLGSGFPLCLTRSRSGRRV